MYIFLLVDAQGIDIDNGIQRSWFMSIACTAVVLVVPINLASNIEASTLILKNYAMNWNNMIHNKYLSLF